MWSSDLLKVFVGITLWTMGMCIRADAAAIGCPPTYEGKPLAGVSLFDGPPTDHADLIPRNGGWDLPGPPRSPHLPNYTLGCTYRGSKDMVVVVLPRTVKVCEFPHYPQVECH